MRRFSALFLCLSLSILLTAHTSSIETYSPGYTSSIETITDQYPIFTFEFADSAVLCLTYGDSIISDDAVYMRAPVVQIPIISTNHIQLFDLELESGYLYAWFIYDYRYNTYSQVRYFTIGSGNTMGNILLKSLLDMFLSDYMQYQSITKMGYTPTGKILINNNEADAEILRYYLKHAIPGKITVRIRSDE